MPPRPLSSVPPPRTLARRSVPSMHWPRVWCSRPALPLRAAR